jgi:signal transduction histidine kinase
LSVTDSGGGFPPKISRSKGMGLRIMQSRAGMIGGALAVGRNAAGGVSVTVSVPDKFLPEKTNHGLKK